MSSPKEYRFRKKGMNAELSLSEGKQKQTWSTVYFNKIPNAPERIELSHGFAKLQRSGEYKTLARVYVDAGANAAEAIQELETKLGKQREKDPPATFVYRGVFSCSYDLDIRKIYNYFQNKPGVSVTAPKSKAEKEAAKPTEPTNAGGIQGKGASKLLKKQKKSKKPKNVPEKKTKRPPIYYQYINLEFKKYSYQIYQTGTIQVISSITLIGAPTFFAKNVLEVVPGVLTEAHTTKEEKQELLNLGENVDLPNNKLHPIATGSNYVKKNQERRPTIQEFQDELKKRKMTTNDPYSSKVRNEMSEYWNEYVRPGGNGVMRVYKLKKSSKTAKPSNKALQSARGKMVAAYQKSGKNIPNQVKNYFGITGSPKKKTTTPKVKMLPPSNRPKSLMNKKNGYYVAPNPQGKLEWYSVPQDTTAGRKTMEKRFGKHKMNVPQHVKNLFAPTERAKKHQETRKKTKENENQFTKELETTMKKQNLTNQLKNKLGKTPTKQNVNNLYEFYGITRKKNKKSTSANIVSVFAQNIKNKYKTPTPKRSPTPKKAPMPPRTLVSYANISSPKPRGQSAWESAHNKLKKQQMVGFTNAAKKEIGYNSLTPSRKRKANQLITNFNHMYKQGHLSERNALNSLKNLI
jgi:hypothetical protein